MPRAADVVPLIPLDGRASDYVDEPLIDATWQNGA
jgi:hypothetical protein